MSPSLVSSHCLLALLGASSALAADATPAATQETTDQRDARMAWWRHPKIRPTGVRASVVAVNRVMTVERRGAGKWKYDEETNEEKTDASARKG